MSPQNQNPYVARQTVLWLMLLVVWAGCRTAPVTQRSQLMLLPEDQEVTMGESAYQQIIAEQPQSTNEHYNQLVQRIGQRIAHVANRPDYAWEFRVFASPEQNAFCLPGGKVGVYEGIIEICENEAELAVVMSHEVAHALQRHGGERMSQAYAANAAENVVRYFTKDREEILQKRVLAAYGVATEYGAILPFSRKHESEADHVGLLLMAQAGYDPSVAPTFWNRFSERNGSSSSDGLSLVSETIQEYCSTHPSDSHRAARLTELQAQAAVIYQASNEKIGTGEVIAR
jgi:predicted Zn-dependent protease